MRLCRIDNICPLSFRYRVRYATVRRKKLIVISFSLMEYEAGIDSVYVAWWILNMKVWSGLMLPRNKFCTLIHRENDDRIKTSLQYFVFAGKRVLRWKSIYHPQCCANGSEFYQGWKLKIGQLSPRCDSHRFVWSGSCHENAWQEMFATFWSDTKKSTIFAVSLAIDSIYEFHLIHRVSFCPNRQSEQII